MRTWEKLYWGVFVTAISLFLFNRLKPDPKQDQVCNILLARLIMPVLQHMSNKTDLLPSCSTVHTVSKQSLSRMQHGNNVYKRYSSQLSLQVKMYHVDMP